MFGKKKVEEVKEKEPETEVLDVVRGLNLPKVSDMKMPQPPEPPMISEEEQELLKQFREKKAAEEKKYTFVVCDSCGSVHAKIV